MNKRLEEIEARSKRDHWNNDFVFLLGQVKAREAERDEIRKDAKKLAKVVTELAIERRKALVSHAIINPPKWMLDGLLADSQSDRCPDCAAVVGETHHDICDVARCLSTKIQRIMCDCGKCGKDKWDGYWPGIKRAYEKKLVCYNTAGGDVRFDLNTAAADEIRGANKKR